MISMLLSQLLSQLLAQLLALRESRRGKLGGLRLRGEPDRVSEFVGAEFFASVSLSIGHITSFVNSGSQKRFPDLVAEVAQKPVPGV